MPIVAKIIVFKIGICIGLKVIIYFMVDSEGIGNLEMIKE